MVTRPLDLATGYLALLVGFLGAWWLIARLSPRPPRRTFLALATCLAVGMALGLWPTVTLFTGTIWPSLVVVMQAATFGTGLIGLALFATLAILVWTLFGRLIDRL